MIADSDRAVALAGVMGGKDSEISDKTRNVFLESAFSIPAASGRPPARTSFSSDSSYRFERRVDPEGVDLGRSRALALIQKYAKPRHISAVIKAGSTLPSAGVGALLALYICHSDFSVIALIGIVLLIGIVKKNAIMMIDFALDAERSQGMAPQEAIYQACLLRFRPV